MAGWLSRCGCAVQQALLGSSGELQNGHRQGWGSGEGLPGLAGLRFHMNNDRRSNSGQHLVPGSPNMAERPEPAVLSGSTQNGRSESMGSDAHLQVRFLTRHSYICSYQFTAPVILHSSALAKRLVKAAVRCLSSF